MGTDIYSRLIMGVRVSEQDFISEGEEIVRCNRCNVSVDISNKIPNYCSDCGNKMYRSKSRTETELLKKYCGLKKYEVENILLNYWRWGTEFMDGLICVDEVFCGHEGKFFVLGPPVLRTRSHRDYDKYNGRVLNFDLALLTEQYKEFQEFLNEIGLERKIEFFLNTYVSV